jgi:aspartate carbamoyltransferase catalytic subunit
MGTSLEKGESQEDALYNIAALDPACMVVRCATELNLQEVSQTLSLPLVNAGWGTLGHPSQALLDLYTLWRESRLGPKEKLLIVGDIRHSRVAASHLELFEKFGGQLALCGPKEFLPEKTSLRCFENIDAGLNWATTVMALRVQFERHGGRAANTADGTNFRAAEYRNQFGLTRERLQKASPSLLVMHPGPINQGVELDSEVLADSRSRVLEQVRNGAFLREALLRRVLNLEEALT